MWNFYTWGFFLSLFWNTIVVIEAMPEIKKQVEDATGVTPPPSAMVLGSTLVLLVYASLSWVGLVASIWFGRTPPSDAS